MTVVRRLDRPAAYAAEVRRLLAAADDEFVPPLTAPARRGVSRTGGAAGPTSIDGYLADCLDGPLLGAVDDGRLVGFAALREVTDGDVLGAYAPSTHVSVLVVAPASRGRGIATRLYDHLLDAPPAGLPDSAVSTKTWHTNRAHIAILESRGFDCIERLADDRKPGVDTVYYARER